MDITNLKLHVRTHNARSAGKPLLEAPLFSENGENMLCKKIVLSAQNVLPRFELGIFMH